MSDVNRYTGAPIGSYESALQAVETIISTPIGSRVMRRQFGGGIAELLGRLTKPSLFVAFQQLLATAIDLYEPRFEVRRIHPYGSTDTVRLGTLGVRIEADFRPRALQGDFTVERVVSFGINFRPGGITVI